MIAMPRINITWWNVENLFDHVNAARPEQLASRLSSELVGWTTAVRNRKLDQLAMIVRMMFGGNGPDLLGICEVENEDVVQLLVDRLNIPGRNYQVAHHMSPDARGIDVSFIVDTQVLRIDHLCHQVVVRRTATRDIFWMELEVRQTGNVFVAVGNHWPSRSGGRYESAPFRMLTGETVSVVVSEIFEEFDAGDDMPVVVMGDFNDEPYDRSMQEYLLGTRDEDRVIRANSPRLLNLMWPLMDEENPGTFKFRSDWNMLDQFLVSKGLLLDSSPVRVVPQSATIFRPNIIQGPGGAPRRHSRPSQRSFDRDGFSDHFPITLTLEVA